ncbi:efflux RND transporter permease subunit [Thiomicrorhabdus xiamenensis]|uniref:Efflux RND transporter permease subunit n=1 Tax=Thiomicrorhabdus xiamenensis TaxID=2739063 RepID=A0A7D4TCC4_9GAMM|nr:efflux RND transporter permease subunit [Thiomicrorhabdus xiamenensis]QKI90226.1 efflux RND transporter permease subunit [Thiomicrorhabdus xiamenensis]
MSNQPSKWNLSALAVREQSVTLYFIIVVALAGIYAFLYMGRAEDPSFDLNTMVVSATWPGATAREMQEQVADPMEKRLEEIAYFDRVETKSRPGRTDLLVIFAQDTPSGMSQDLYYQVRKRLNDLAPTLPQGVQGPFFNDDFEDVYFTLYSLTAPGWSHQELVQVADEMSVALRRVDGIKKVNLIGEQPSKVFIDFDQERLSQMALDINTLQEQIAAHLQKTSGGFIESNGPRVYLRAPQNGRELTVSEIAALPLSINGTTIRLSDVAEVYKGYQSPASYLIRDKGEQAVLVGVVMAKGVDGLKLEKSLIDFEQYYIHQLPAGVLLDKVTNQADAIHGAVSTFQLKFVTALLVVLVVSLLALGLRAGFIVALAVPLTLAMTFMFMFLNGLNFDRISLGALIISLGLLVDDAIIAIEMMLVKMAEGMEKAKAAAYAWSVTAAPMLVGTLVTVVGFLPIGLAQSQVGDYAGGIFWVLGMTLIASWLVAVYFTPYLGVKMLPKVSNPHQELFDSRFYRFLRSVVQTCVRYKKSVVLLTFAVFVLSAIAMKDVVEKQFFPSSDRPELMIDIAMPEGTSIEATDKVALRVEELIKGHPQVKSLSSYIGQGAPRFFLALNPELPNPAFAKIIVVTHGKEERDQLQAELQAQIDQGLFPEARVRAHPLLFGPPVPWPVTFRVVGPDPETLRAIAKRLQNLMAEQDFTIDPHLQWGQRSLVMRLKFDSERLLQLGMTQQQLMAQLDAQLQGSTIGQIRQDNRTLEVVLRSDRQTRRNLGNLGDILIRTPSATVPLSHLAELVPQYEDMLFDRRNRELFLAVNSEVTPGMQPPVATQKLLDVMGPLKDSLPPGYRIDVGGSVEESAKAEASIQAMMPLMLLMITLLLMLFVRSFSSMFMVLLTAPLGLIGAVAALVLFQQPFGFVANLGLIGLAGILMRNTLILTGQIDDNARHGMSAHEALVDATLRRARPVLLTAVAAMLAFIPLTTSTFWGPMAFVLIGGVGVGTLLTLLFLPALYALWFKVKVA